MKIIELILTLVILLFFQNIAAQTANYDFTREEIREWEKTAKRVTIVRDKWGVPHIYGKTDADAVFGLMFAQCEDDFKRVEYNNLENLGRLSEAEGEKFLNQDLVMRLIYDSVAAINDYKNSPRWFKKLLDASAAGVNYYLYKNPGVSPVVLKRFEPWFQLMRSNGSISSTNTSGISFETTGNFYSNKVSSHGNGYFEPKRRSAIITGSNGFAVGPTKTVSGNPILYINPHVTFYYRQEMHMVSEEGLNVYGAVTWGQFFIFQGFNEHCGWMHTSGDADLSDLYIEKHHFKDGKFYYEYENNLRPATIKTISLKVKNDTTHRLFNTFFTHHGPVMAGNKEKWLTLRENNRSMKGLLQSWLRTKAKGFDSFEKTMELRSNTSDNTVFADNKGNIAYWHGNFIPVRDTAFDWSRPVDGTTRATEWKGIHLLKDIVQVKNPKTGFIQSCNSTPFTASGSASPERKNFPVYMAPDHENARSVNAIRLLSGQKDFTLQKMITVGYNTYLSAFDIFLPSLFNAYEENKNEISFSELKDIIEVLKNWNRESSSKSIATTIAILWANKLQVPKNVKSIGRYYVEGQKDIARHLIGSEMLRLLLQTKKELVEQFGTWQVKWGDINRYQRLNGDYEQTFSDDAPSLPVGLADTEFGCLPAFECVKCKGCKKNYGIAGNSFVAAVEFGKRIKAKSILTGGTGMVPSSKHFMDQAQMFIDGEFKDVLFYKKDVIKNARIKYSPGRR